MVVYPIFRKYCKCLAGQVQKKAFFQSFSEREQFFLVGKKDPSHVFCMHSTMYFL